MDKKSSAIMHGMVFARIHSHLPNLSPAERRIAQFILDHPEPSLYLRIVDLAKACNVSPPMVTRFTTRIGYSGFAELKDKLRVDILSADGRFLHDVEAEDSESTILEKVLDLTVQGIRDTLTTLDPQQLKRAAEAILASDPLFFAPAGIASTGVITVFQQKLINLEILCVLPPPHNVAAGFVPMVKSGDVVFGISHSGTPDIVINFLEQCRDRGATTICLTNYSNAPIVSVSDIQLITAASPANPIFGEAISVRSSQIAVLDALYAMMAMMRYREGPDSEEQ